MHEAKSQLSRLIAAALNGEDVIIARGSEPLVRLTPIQPMTAKRTPGRYKGMFSVPDDFFDPLSDEELALWEDGPVGGSPP